MSESSADENSSVENFVVNLVINLIIGMALFFLFLILRSIFKKYYHARTDPTIKPHSRMPFAWIWHSIVVKDKKYWYSHKVDVIVYLRLLKFFLLVMVILIIPFLILIPINATGGNKDEPETSETHTSGLDVITLANLRERDPKKVAHVVLIWWVSLWIYFLAHWLYKAYVHDRRRWIDECDTAKSFSLLVSDIPEKYRSNKKLKKWFIDNFPGKPLGVHIVRKCRGLTKKRNRYYKAIDKLEKAEWKATTKGKNPTTRTGPLGLVGSKVDAQNHHNQERLEYQQKIEQRISDPDHYAKTPTAFVTMNNSFSSRIHCVPTKHPYRMQVSPAPEYNDVHWRGCHLSHTRKILIRWLVRIFLFFLIFFWAIPVTFLQGVFNLSNLSELGGFGWLDWVLDLSPVVRGIIEGFLPALVLIIFMAILLPLLRFLSSLEGYPSIQQYLSASMTKYFLFLLFNVYLVSAIAGSVFNSISEFIDEPTSIPETLANSLPKHALFFINFIIVATFVKSLLRLIGIAGLIIYLIKRTLTARTQKEKARLDAPRDAKYDGIYAYHLLIYCLVIGFCIMSPLIIPFGLIYFAINYLIDRYNYLYVYKNLNDGGGIFMRRAFHFIMLGLLIMQLVMIGLLALTVSGPGIAIIPLPFLTLLFWYFVVRKYYWMERLGCISDKWNPQKKGYVEKHAKLSNKQLKIAYTQPEFVPINPDKDYSPRGELTANDIEEVEKNKTELDEEDFPDPPDTDRGQ